MQKISQESYDKALGQARLALNGVMQPLRMYGQDVYVDGAIESIMDIVEAFGMRVRGKSVPIVPKKRR